MYCNKFRNKSNIIENYLYIKTGSKNKEVYIKGGIMLKLHKKIILLFLVSVLFISCSKHIKKVAYPDLSDGKYDSEFPYQSSSKELEEITKTVRFLNVIAFYDNYVFDFRMNIKKDKMKNDEFKKYTVNKILYNKTASGTATVIHHANNRIALLTCEHIIDFQDTVITYFLSEDFTQTEIIKSIAIKVKQHNYVIGLPNGGNVELLISDKKRDVALMGSKYNVPLNKIIPVFDYPFGEAKELTWGTFLYLVGFPKGYKMITRGIVSSPNRDKYGSFLSDASFNRGFSGGIILALRDGVPNFELVGMATSVSAETDYLLSPGNIKNYDPTYPYSGNMYIRDIKNINYGITYSISIEAIKKFIKDHKDELLDKGYDLKGTFWK